MDLEVGDCKSIAGITHEWRGKSFGWWPTRSTLSAPQIGCGELLDRSPATTDDAKPNYPDGHGAEAGREDAGKNRLELLPFDALEAVGQVLTHGAAKYSDRNWERGMKWSRVIGSMLRHLSARLRGEVFDPETKITHMAHVACNALFLVSYENRKVGENDLP